MNAVNYLELIHPAKRNGTKRTILNGLTCLPLLFQHVSYTLNPVESNHVIALLIKAKA